MKNHIAFALLVLTVAVTAVLAPVEAWASPCNLANTAGNWDYTYTGTIFTLNGPLPAAAVGHFHQDSAGKISGSQTRSVAGNAAAEDISGTISVNSDCTATATVNVLVNGELQRTAVLQGVLDNNRNHGRDIFQSLTLADGTNVPVVLTADLSRITPRD
jgi:hypothetical protein